MDRVDSLDGVDEAAAGGVNTEGPLAGPEVAGESWEIFQLTTRRHFKKKAFRLDSKRTSLVLLLLRGLMLPDLRACATRPRIYPALWPRILT